MKPSRIPVRANLLPRQRILNDKILEITREPTARIREEGFAPHTSAVLAVSINRFRATGKNHKALFSLALPGLRSHRHCRILRNHAPHLGGCTNCGGVVTIDHSKSPATVTPTVDFTALAHASNFVAPGALRIDSVASEESPLKHVAAIQMAR